MSVGWAIKWRSENLLDGKREYLMGCQNVAPRLFKTRATARAYVKHYYGYIATRPDLKAEPHGWKMPTPVKVTVRIEEVA